MIRESGNRFSNPLRRASASGPGLWNGIDHQVDLGPADELEAAVDLSSRDIGMGNEHPRDLQRKVRALGVHEPALSIRVDQSGDALATDIGCFVMIALVVDGALPRDNLGLGTPSVLRLDELGKSLISEINDLGA